MGFQEDIAAARAVVSMVEPVELFIGDVPYTVVAKRLSGMQWSALTAEYPPTAPLHRAYGFDPVQVGMAATRQYGELWDENGDTVDTQTLKNEKGVVVSDPWADFFGVLDADALTAIASAWWFANVSENRERVEAAKKARSAGGATS